MKKIYAFLRHNSGMFIALIVCSLAVVYAYSCQSQVISLVQANRKVTRQELVDEVEAMLASAETKFEDLDRQDLIRDTIFNSILDIAQGGSINPVGVVQTVIGILGIGAVVDNVRKRTHINTLKGESLNVKVKEAVERIIHRPSP